MTRDDRQAQYSLPCAHRLTVSSGLVGACAKARRQEGLVKPALARGDEEMLLRMMVTQGVPAAREVACDTARSTEDVWSWCLSLTGQPWSEAPARRDMRERIRVWQHVRREGAWVPHTQDELLALWSVATKGEYPLYRESATAQFRTEGVPFAHGAIPFEPVPLPSGKQTAPPEEIPAQVDALLELVAESTLPLEARAAAAHFALELIHPFRDGNGHCARMLACSMLAHTYALPCLIALVARIQSSRRTLSSMIGATVREQADTEPLCKYFVELLIAAQQDILSM